jgi:AcrR family transcriptional regulator
MRTKSTERRDAILRTAREMFEKDGFERVSMSEIAARLGGSKATLYNYFNSKEELLVEIVRYAAAQHVEELLALVGQPGSMADNLQAVGERVLKIFHSAERLAARRMLIAAAANSSVGRLFYETGTLPALKRMAALFKEAMDQGRLRRADPQVAAAHFRGLLEGEVGESGLLNARPEPTPAQIKAIVKRATTVFMMAYGPNANVKQAD